MAKPAQWFDPIAPAATAEELRQRHEAEVIGDTLMAIVILERHSPGGRHRVADALREWLFTGADLEASLGVQTRKGGRPVHAAFWRMVKLSAIRVAAKNLPGKSVRAIAAGVARIVRSDSGEFGDALRKAGVPASSGQIARLMRHDLAMLCRTRSTRHDVRNGGSHGQ